MIKISELKEGDVLKSEVATATVLQHLGKVVILESEKGTTFTFSEKELNDSKFKLVPPTPEKKYYMGFEVREYPEKPIVAVGRGVYLRRLIEVKEDYAICENEDDKNGNRWDYIYRIPETRIVEPTSSGTREVDGC